MSSTIHLSHLPVELLDMTVKYLHLDKTLGKLSRVNKQFRALCAPYIFQKLRIPFSRAGLDRLEQASKSPMSRHVKTICYEAPELIDPRWLPVRQKRRYKLCLLTKS